MSSDVVTPPPSDDASERDGRGRFLPGHSTRLVPGLHRDQWPPELAALRDEIDDVLERMIADDGGAGEISTRRRALLEDFARIQRRVTQLDSMLELRGLIDKRGKLRVAWLQRLEGLVATARALASMLGLQRTPKPVSFAQAIARPDSPPSGEPR